MLVGPLLCTRLEKKLRAKLLSALTKAEDEGMLSQEALARKPGVAVGVAVAMGIWVGVWVGVALALLGEAVMVGVMVMVAAVRVSDSGIAQYGQSGGQPRQQPRQMMKGGVGVGLM